MPDNGAGNGSSEDRGGNEDLESLTQQMMHTTNASNDRMMVTQTHNTSWDTCMGMQAVHPFSRLETAS